MGRRWQVGSGVTAAAALAGALTVGLVASSPAVGAPVLADAHTPTPTPPPSPTPTPPAPSPTPTTPDDLLLPDLIALKASGLRVRRSGDGRRLRFTSSLGNIGRGPLEVRPNRNQPCPPGQHNATQVIYRDANRNHTYNARRDTDVARSRAGCMVYHPRHDHWHFDASARYTLLERGTERRVVVSVRRKVSFCLRDSARLPERYGRWPYGNAYGPCAKGSRQGISAGWMDVYQSYLAGQSLRLPRRLANGVYCLETRVDPQNRIRELDDTNNGSVRALAIRGDRVKPRPSSLCR